MSLIILSQILQVHCTTHCLPFAKLFFNFRSSGSVESSINVRLNDPYSHDNYNRLQNKTVNDAQLNVATQTRYIILFIAIFVGKEGMYNTERSPVVKVKPIIYSRRLLVQALVCDQLQLKEQFW